MSWVRDNRAKMEQYFLGSAQRQYLSPAYLGQYRVTLPLVIKHAHGRFIDLGCGDMPYRPYIEQKLEAYDSLDFMARSDQVKYVGNIQNMAEIRSDSYDSAICLEVLEHVPDPQAAVREIYRIMKKGGIVVLSVPHLSRLHDIPYDYYRYTRFGLEYLLKEGGFQVLSMQERGGLLSFLGHQISLILLSLFWGIPILRHIVFAFNALLISRLFYWLDKVLKLNEYFALGYCVVVQKES